MSTTKAKASTARSAKKKSQTAAPTILAPTAAPTICTTPQLPSLSPQSPMPVSNCATIFTLLEDFENIPLTGWTNGFLDTTSTQQFTSFLGRYVSQMLPEKLYISIPTTASMLKFEFDFYEIDSWNDDWFNVVINCVTIPLGNFEFVTDEGTREGDVEDVHFKTQSLGPPLNMGFDAYPDQTHHVTINLPGRFVNGFLKVRFESGLDQKIDNESFGIDNIQITAYQCGM